MKPRKAILYQLVKTSRLQGKKKNLALNFRIICSILDTSPAPKLSFFLPKKASRFSRDQPRPWEKNGSYQCCPGYSPHAPPEQKLGTASEGARGQAGLRKSGDLAFLASGPVAGCEGLGFSWAPSGTVRRWEEPAFCGLGLLHSALALSRGLLR